MAPSRLTFADELPGVLDGINIFDLLVMPNRFDSWESQSKPARMTVARLNRIERDLQNDLWSHRTKMAIVSDRGPKEVLR